MNGSVVRWGCVLALAAGVLAACGGDGSSDSGAGTVTKSPAASPTIRCVVAIGPAVPRAMVTATGANGERRWTTADTMGRYVLDVAGLDAPIVVRATGAMGRDVSLASVLPVRASSGHDTVNVTSLTTAIAALLNAAGGYDPETLRPEDVSPDAYRAALQRLSTAIAPELESAGLAGRRFDPIQDAFELDHRGASQLLDVVGVRPTADGVVLSNRLQRLSATGNPATVTVTAADRPGYGPVVPSGRGAAPVTKSAGTAGATNATVKSTIDFAPPPGDALAALEARIAACLASPGADRVEVSAGVTDPAGVLSYPWDAVKPVCRDFVDAGYLQISYRYGERWAQFLRPDSEFEGSPVSISLLYVVAGGTTVGDGNAYIVNVHAQDAQGNVITQVEVLARETVDGVDTFRVHGNREPMILAVQPSLNWSEQLLAGGATSNQVTASYQITVGPHRFDGKGWFRSGPGGRVMPQFVCAWLSGPFVANGVGHDPANPKGGVLLKVPLTTSVASQYYMGVAQQFWNGFDPVNDLGDRSTLFEACESTVTVAGEPVSGTRNIGNLMALNGFGVAPTNFQYRFIGEADRQAFLATYGQAAVPAFTVYAFRSGKDLEIDPASDPTIRPWGDRATTPFSERIEAFWALRHVAQVRMLGGLPYVENDGTYYTGASRFRPLDAATKTAFLGSQYGTVAAGGTISIGWMDPAGVRGIDRVGGNTTANTSCGIRFPSQASVPVPRSAASTGFEVPMDWLGYASLGQQMASAPTGCTVTSVNRQLWTRVYDASNTQLWYTVSRTIP